MIQLNQPQIGKSKLSRASFKLTVTARDKKLLVVLGFILFLAVNYLLIFKFLIVEMAKLEHEADEANIKVSAARADLENEANIIKEYEILLAQTKDKANVFFPKTYPYKDRYILLMDNVVKSSGATALRLNFDYPEVGAVPLAEPENIRLPDYPLLDLAAKINSLAKNPAVGRESDKNPAAEPEAGKTIIPSKTLPADAVVRMPSTLEFEGSYAQARSVIKSLEDLERTLAIESIAIEKAKESSLVRVQLNLAFYAVEKVDNGTDPFNGWHLEGNYGKEDPFKP